jgi:uncharacterized protein YjiS (DUF1127 family)
MRLENLKIDEMGFRPQAGPRPRRRENSMKGAVTILARWRERARQRAELARLGRLAREDIGITEADVWRETRKPPWRP